MIFSFGTSSGSYQGKSAGVWAVGLWLLMIAAAPGAGALEWSLPSALNSNAADDAGDDLYPRVATDGAGTWMVVWASNDTLDGTIGSDRDILYSVSTDNGASWSAAAVLNSSADSDSGADYYPDVTTDGAGNWIAVWYSSDSLWGTIGADEDILYSVSTDNGASWSQTAALNTNAAVDAGDDSVPHVNTDGAGRWIAHWRSTDTLGGTIGTDEDILYAISEDNGTNWSAPAALNSFAASDTEGDFWHRLATDGAGNWVAIWTTDHSFGATVGTDGDVAYAVSSDGGTSWSTAAVLNSNAAGDTGDDADPYLATDGEGRWFAVWITPDTLGGTTGIDTDVLYAVSEDNGASWSDVATLNSNAESDIGNEFYPHLAMDDGGNWIALWASNEMMDDTIGWDFDILYTVSEDRGTSWSEVAVLNANAATDTGDDVLSQVVTDGAGHWIALWSSTDSLGGTGMDNDIVFSMPFIEPEIAVAPGAVDFGSQNTGAGSAGPLAVTMDNPATSPLLAEVPLVFDSISISGDATGSFAFETAPDTSELAGGTSRTLAIVFDPDSAGTKTATLRIVSNAAEATTTTVALVGVGTEADIDVSPTVLSFAEGSGYEVDVVEGETASTRSLTILNAGNDELSFTGGEWFAGLTLSGDEDYWILSVTPDTGTPLASGESIEVVIGFVPSETTRTLGKTATLTVTSDDPDEASVTVDIDGDAVPVTLSGFAVE